LGRCFEGYEIPDSKYLIGDAGCRMPDAGRLEVENSVLAAGRYFVIAGHF